MKRKMKSFRLCDIAECRLENIAREENRTQTEVIERALEKYRLLTMLATKDNELGNIAKMLLE